MSPSDIKMEKSWMILHLSLNISFELWNALQKEWEYQKGPCDDHDKVTEIVVLQNNFSFFAAT
jgi:hypothetical protein